MMGGGTWGLSSINNQGGGQLGPGKSMKIISQMQVMWMTDWLILTSINSIIISHSLLFKILLFLIMVENKLIGVSKALTHTLQNLIIALCMFNRTWRRKSAICSTPRSLIWTSSRSRTRWTWRGRSTSSTRPSRGKPWFGTWQSWWISLRLVSSLICARTVQ